MRFAADYGKRVCKCKKCREQIEKTVFPRFFAHFSSPFQSLRLAKILPNPFHTSEDGDPGEMKEYYHAECLFSAFAKARATTPVITAAGEIEGG